MKDDLDAELIWRAVFLGLVATVAWLALTPAPPPTLDSGWDKLNHGLAFCALAIAGRCGFPGSWVRLVSVIGGLLLFGASIEVLQLFVPSRSAELNDWLADVAGIVIGLLLAAAGRRVLRLT